jgi:hypothetical protein
MMERMTGIDFNGDGVIGRPRDVRPHYPAIVPYQSMRHRGPMRPRYGYGGYTYF